MAVLLHSSVLVLPDFTLQHAECTPCPVTTTSRKYMGATDQLYTPLPPPALPSAPSPPDPPVLTPPPPSRASPLPPVMRFTG